MLVINITWIFYSTASSRIRKKKTSWWKWVYKFSLSPQNGNRMKNKMYFVLGLQGSSVFRKILPNVIGRGELLQTCDWASQCWFLPVSLNWEISWDEWVKGRKVSVMYVNSHTDVDITKSVYSEHLRKAGETCSGVRLTFGPFTGFSSSE